MVLKKIKIARGIKAALSAIVVVSLIAFANKEYNVEVCTDILVSIENQYNNYYLDDNDIIALASNYGEDVIVGKEFHSISLKEVEERIKTSSYVRDAEVYKDLKGNIIVKSMLRRPIARIISENGADVYISEEGMLLPVSEKFNSRVVLISGKGIEGALKENLPVSESTPELFEIINFINSDEFWKAQIAQVDIDAKGDIILYPQITKQQVEFGKASNLEEKFNKLKIFYKQILPRKGWNSYVKVNLKYKGQIIAD